MVTKNLYKEATKAVTSRGARTGRRTAYGRRVRRVETDGRYRSRRRAPSRRVGGGGGRPPAAPARSHVGPLGTAAGGRGASPRPRAQGGGALNGLKTGWGGATETDPLWMAAPMFCGVWRRGQSHGSIGGSKRLIRLQPNARNAGSVALSTAAPRRGWF